MLRLIDTEPAATGQRDLRKATQPLSCTGVLAMLRVFSLPDERVDVVAHQIELVPTVLVRGMQATLAAAVRR